MSKQWIRAEPRETRQEKCTLCDKVTEHELHRSTLVAGDWWFCTEKHPEIERAVESVKRYVKGDGE